MSKTNTHPSVASVVSPTSPAPQAAPAPTAAPAVTVAPLVSAADIQALVGAVDTFALVLALGYEPLSAEALKRLPHPQHESDKFVASIADLAQRYKVDSPSNPVQQMLANQKTAQTLLPVAERLLALGKLVQDATRFTRCASYTSATVLYAQLKAEGRTNPIVRGALAPLRESLRPTFVTPEGTKTHKASRRAPKAPKGGGTTPPAGAPTEATAAAAAPAVVATAATGTKGVARGGDEAVPSRAPSRTSPSSRKPISKLASCWGGSPRSHFAAQPVSL